jgi:hypothetical protein
MREAKKRSSPVSPWFFLLSFALFSVGEGFAEEQASEDSFLDSATIPAADLEALRGGDFDVTTTVQNIQDQQATVIGGEFNAHTIANGSITFEEHALNNFRGVGLFMNNTGNGNAIDAALGVTFYLQ